MKIQIKNVSSHPMPKYQTAGAAGFDVQANLDAPVTLGSLERAMIPTGLYFGLPTGYEAQVRGRSGLAAKHGIGLANGVGTLDADYRGELKVILVNLSNEPYTVEDGDRVAQVVIGRAQQVELEEVSELEATARHDGGFGHTGR